MQRYKIWKLKFEASYQLLFLAKIAYLYKRLSAGEISSKPRFGPSVSETSQNPGLELMSPEMFIISLSKFKDRNFYLQAFKGTVSGILSDPPYTKMVRSNLQRHP